MKYSIYSIYSVKPELGTQTLEQRQTADYEHGCKKQNKTNKIKKQQHNYTNEQRQQEKLKQ